MTRRSFPPYRADHVGSLLRPSYLHSARERFAAGELSAEALRETEDRAVREVVAMQEDIGLSTATDGEFRRSTWHMDFIYKLDGINASDSTMSVRFHNEAGDIEFAPSATRIDGRIRLGEPIFGEDFAYLAGQVSTATPKLTMPSPSMVHYRGGPAAISPEVYPDIEGFWDDLSAAYADQIRAMGARGCKYLQLDDTSLAYLNDPAQRAQLAERGDDAEHQHLRNIKQMNAALAARPADMAVTTHMCRGNFRSSWVAEGGYEFVAEAVFNELDVDGFFLEFDDERSGGFAPLRFVPDDKVVVLGLVTTKRGELESKDALKRRIEEATRYIDIDQLCLSPQCGFASTEEGNALDIEQQAAKLRLIVETAREVWGD